MCLDDQILNTYLDGELAEPWRTQVIEHLNYCTACAARFEQLKALHHSVSGSRLTEDEIAPHQDKVLVFLEKNYIQRKRALKFLKHSFRVTMPTALTAAAAFVVLLSAALIIPRQQGLVPTGEIIPNVSVPVAGAVTQVRATENLSAAQLLEHFTLEEILQYLSSRGYEVEVKVKGIKPLGQELPTVLQEGPPAVPDSVGAEDQDAPLTETEATGGEPSGQ